MAAPGSAVQSGHSHLHQQSQHNVIIGCSGSSNSVLICFEQMSSCNFMNSQTHERNKTDLNAVIPFRSSRKLQLLLCAFITRGHPLLAAWSHTSAGLEA